MAEYKHTIVTVNTNELGNYLDRLVNKKNAEIISVTRWNYRGSSFYDVIYRVRITPQRRLRIVND